jgi:hypothetical protein
LTAMKRALAWLLCILGAASTPGPTSDRLNIHPPWGSLAVAGDTVQGTQDWATLIRLSRERLRLPQELPLPLRERVEARVSLLDVEGAEVRSAEECSAAGHMYTTVRCDEGLAGEVPAPPLGPLAAT